MTKSENRNGKEQGITLIALVVTIIVLIILAGVSIAMVVGDNGIITQAQKAKENIQIASNEEQRQIANLEETLGESLEGIESEEKEIKLEDLKAGDYIEYDSGSNGKILCRVLYPIDSEYGLQIITNKNVKNVSLGTNENNWEKGKESYNTAIEDLNNEAEAYMNTKYAVDARCVGSVPTVDEEGMFIEKNKGTETTVILPPSTWSSYTKPNGWENDNTGCYDADINYEKDEVQMKNMIEEEETQEVFWLASRIVDSNSSGCGFGIRNMDGKGDIQGMDLCGVFSIGIVYGSLRESGFRPCLSLRTDIKIVEGKGSKEVPYILGGK